MYAHTRLTSGPVVNNMKKEMQSIIIYVHARVRVHVTEWCARYVGQKDDFLRQQVCYVKLLRCHSHQIICI